MIENTLLHFKTKAAFNTELEAGNIKDDSIVFIDESKEIWTHGTYYDCSKLDLSNIATKEELASKLDAVVAANTYATKTEIEGKQDTISDIETIRSGAAKGATALQSYTETDPVFSASAAAGIKSSDISNWNSKTSNTGTITGVKMNGASKGTSGVVDLGTVITLHQDISGKLDVTTAAATYAKKTEAVIANGTVTSVIAMTQSEYDALATKNPTTLYIITES